MRWTLHSTTSFFKRLSFSYRRPVKTWTHEFVESVPSQQDIERAGEGGRPDLERGGHDSLGLARGVIAGGDFPARL